MSNDPTPFNYLLPVLAYYLYISILDDVVSVRFCWNFVYCLSFTKSTTSLLTRKKNELENFNMAANFKLEKLFDGDFLLERRINDPE